MMVEQRHRIDGRGFDQVRPISIEVGKLPREVWPMIQSHWSDPKCFEGMALYLEALPASAAAVASDTCSTPLIVLSAGNSSPMQRAEHERLAAASPHGRIEIVPGSGHWIQLNRPDAVIRATTEMIARVRAT
jgi:pimeloyl-ACP methyl ester carboxylesterase